MGKCKARLTPGAYGAAGRKECPKRATGVVVAGGYRFLPTCEEHTAEALGATPGATVEPIKRGAK